MPAPAHFGLLSMLSEQPRTLSELAVAAGRQPADDVELDQRDGRARLGAARARRTAIGRVVMIEVTADRPRRARARRPRRRSAPGRRARAARSAVAAAAARRPRQSCARCSLAATASAAVVPSRRPRVGDANYRFDRPVPSGGVSLAIGSASCTSDDRADRGDMLVVYVAIALTSQRRTASQEPRCRQEHPHCIGVVLVGAAVVAANF